MPFVVLAVCILTFGGAASFVVTRHRASAVVSAAGSMLGGSAATAGAFAALFGSAGTERLTIPWALPFGSISLEIDALSAFFLIPVALIPAIAALYSPAYHQKKGAHSRAQGLWFNLLSAAMIVVVTARDGMLFLIAWEVMTVASFLLVVCERSDVSSRAGWIYLVATHIGTSCLVVLFLLGAGPTGPLGFDSLASAATPATVLFVLAFVGFGTKAGFVPMHVWLPEAHPAAPSPVSAVMSGVMIKTGIYGIVRTVTYLGVPQPEWGWGLLLFGVASGLYGVLHALAQHDMKRLLAYCSVENIGIIGMGLGLGLLGKSYDLPLVSALGFAAALLHVLNHSLFKSLLFLGAGAVDYATGTREIDRLGGLMKRMPVSGCSFLIGAAAISGLPPLNGFVSELLLFLGAASVIVGSAGTPSHAVAGFAIFAALPLIGSLAAACFAKAFGITFLGEPREPAIAQNAREVPRSMRIAMLILVLMCVASGLAAPALLWLVTPAASLLSADTAALSAYAEPILTRLSIIAAILIAVVLLIVLLRRIVIAGRGATAVRRGPTWDCGYVNPTARMQYTASSFVRPILTFFHPVVRSRHDLDAPNGYFPEDGSLRVEPRDPFHSAIFTPLFRAVAWLAGKLRHIHQGRLQYYILYIALTVLVLLFWKVR